MKKILFTILFTPAFSSLTWAQRHVGAFDVADKLSGPSTQSQMPALTPGFLESFSLAGMIGGLIFSSFGFVAFVYGKKQSLLAPLVIGILMIVFPCFTQNTIAIYSIGIILSVSLYYYRR